MRRWLLGAVLLAALGSGAGAQDAEGAIREVISDQIAAFEADDFATAFGFASPAIREMFGTPDRFGRMVREGYPMVWRPGGVRFAGLTERDGRSLQRVIVTDAGGALHVLEYAMVPGEDGWRIDGVRLLEEGDVGA